MGKYGVLVSIKIPSRINDAVIMSNGKFLTRILIYAHRILKFITLLYIIGRFIMWH